MSKVKFYFPREIEYAVVVEVEDPSDYDQMDQALTTAYEQLPSGVCAHCSGYGSNGKWFLDLDTMDLEAQYAENEEGDVVWGKRPYDGKEPD